MYKDLTKEKFGRLTPTFKVGSYKGNATWVCLCDCGETTKPISSNNLRSGNTKSCGCSSTMHGMYDTKTYKSWANMIQRCTNSKSTWFHRYGGRGVVVCEEWLDFSNFYRDMGDRPTGLSLDRIDNDGDYTPSNCKWSTPKEQANNRS